VTDSLTEFPSPSPAAFLERIAVQHAHQMRDAYDIGDALVSLAAAGATLSVYPPDGGAPLAACIAAVDPVLPHFTLEFAEALPAVPGHATIVAALGEGALLQFELESNWTALPGTRQVAAAFPAACLVQERRSAPRHDTPLTGYYAASMRLANAQVELPLCDYASGGIAFRAAPEAVFALQVGQKLPDVRLQLGPALTVVADLEIRMLRPFRSYLLGEQVQVGCSFDRIEMRMQEEFQAKVAQERG